MLGYIDVILDIPKTVARKDLGAALFAFRQKLAKEHQIAILRATLQPWEMLDSLRVECYYSGDLSEEHVEKVLYDTAEADLVSNLSGSDLQTSFEQPSNIRVDDFLWGTLSVGNPVQILDIKPVAELEELLELYLPAPPRKQKGKPSEQDYTIEVWGSLITAEADEKVANLILMVLGQEGRKRYGDKPKWTWKIREIEVFKPVDGPIRWHIKTDVVAEPGTSKASLATYKANLTRKLAAGEPKLDVEPKLITHWRLVA